MSDIQEYVAQLEGLVKTQREVIEQYRKLDENNKTQIELCETLIAAYKEMICRLIEGRISEETKAEMLEKFRGLLGKRGS